VRFGEETIKGAAPDLRRRVRRGSFVAIVDRVQEWIGSAEQHDDLTLVVWQ